MYGIKMLWLNDKYKLLTATYSFVVLVCIFLSHDCKICGDAWPYMLSDGNRHALGATLVLKEWKINVNCNIYTPNQHGKVTNWNEFWHTYIYIIETTNLFKGKQKVGFNIFNKSNESGAMRGQDEIVNWTGLWCEYLILKPHSKNVRF